MDRQTLAGMMDHTLLHAKATAGDIDQLCREADQIGAASVCVNPYWVERACKNLEDSQVMVCTVIGFPLGANSTSVKVFETEEAIRHGADEVDMVINLGALLGGDEDSVFEDIKAVVNAAGDATVKVIIETCYLNDSQKRVACELSLKAGADFVKTSTGFGTAGATFEDVALMKSVVGDSVQVKASGGIRTYEDAMKMIEAGANRLGVSASFAILEGIKPSAD